MAQIKVISSGVLITVDNAPVWANGIWECGSQRFTDIAKNIYAPMPVYPAIGPIGFQMLFTTQEAVAANALRATDPNLESFWKLIDDPRTDVVDMNLKSVQNAISYTLTAINASGVLVDIPTRLAEILAGILE